MPDKEYMDAFHACSAQSLIEDRGRRRLQKEQERRERIEDAVEANKKSTLPMVEELKAIVESLQEQNSILQSQIDEAKKDGEEAKKEASKSVLLDFFRCSNSYFDCCTYCLLFRNVNLKQKRNAKWKTINH